MRIFGILLLCVSAGAFGLAVHDAGVMNAEWVLGCLLTGLVSGGLGLPVVIGAGCKPEQRQGLNCPDNRAYHFCITYPDAEPERPAPVHASYRSAYIETHIEAIPTAAPGHYTAHAQTPERIVVTPDMVE